MTQNNKNTNRLPETANLPYWDDESFLNYLREHCTVSVDEFCDMLLEECDKMDREEALQHENHTHRRGLSQGARVFA